MAVAVTAKRDATRRDAARTRGPSHPVYDRMADGWLAGRPVCRSAWQGPTHGTCASALFVPPRIRHPPRFASVSHAPFTLIPARLTEACYSFSR